MFHHVGFKAVVQSVLGWFMYLIVVIPIYIDVCSTVYLVLPEFCGKKKSHRHVTRVGFEPTTFKAVASEPFSTISVLALCFY